MYNAAIQDKPDAFRGLGYWVSLVPKDYNFTGRIKYVSREFSETKVYFEISYQHEDIGFRFWPWPLFYVRKLPPVTQWVNSDHFYSYTQETIVECEK